MNAATTATATEPREAGMNKMWATVVGASATVLTLTIAACGNGSAGDSNTVTVAGDVPLAYV